MTGIWQDKTLYMLVLSAIFLMILVIGEYIRNTVHSKREIPRKSIHFLSGITALSLPFLIQSHWLVLMLTVGFSALMLVTKKKGWLRSIHDVDRKSYGALYFPIAVYGIFLLAHSTHILYFIPILVMTVSDSLAALLGGKYGSIKYEVEENVKSLEGSIVFFFATFLCVHLPLLLMTQIEKLNTVLIAVVIALLVTGFEAISISGSDNIFVPFGTYYILSKMIDQTLAATFGDIGLLLLMIAITVPISMKTKLFKESGLIGMVLINYAAWSLCGFYWFLPLLLAQILLFLLTAYSMHKVKEEVTGYQIKVFVYSAIIPAILIFAANTVKNHASLYLPYLTSIIGQIAIICYFYLSIMIEADKKCMECTRNIKIMRGMMCGITSTVFIGIAPIVLYLNKDRFISLVIILLGVWLALSVFEFLYVKYRLQGETILRQKMRLLSVSVGVLAVLMIKTYFSG